MSVREILRRLQCTRARRAIRVRRLWRRDQFLYLALMPWQKIWKRSVLQKRQSEALEKDRFWISKHVKSCIHTSRNTHHRPAMQCNVLSQSSIPSTHHRVVINLCIPQSCSVSWLFTTTLSWPTGSSSPPLQPCTHL